MIFHVQIPAKLVKIFIKIKKNFHFMYYLLTPNPIKH